VIGPADIGSPHAHPLGFAGVRLPGRASPIRGLTQMTKKDRENWKKRKQVGEDGVSEASISEIVNGKTR
jgi:hypothetical protein